MSRTRVRRDTGGLQHEGHEVRGYMGECLVEQRRRLIPEGKFRHHPHLPFLVLGLYGMFSNTDGRRQGRTQSPYTGWKRRQWVVR